MDNCPFVLGRHPGLKSNGAGGSCRDWLACMVLKARPLNSIASRYAIVLGRVVDPILATFGKAEVGFLGVFV